jgi:hypothetical protein
MLILFCRAQNSLFQSFDFRFPFRRKKYYLLLEWVLYFEE